MTKLNRQNWEHLRGLQKIQFCIDSICGNELKDLLILRIATPIIGFGKSKVDIDRFKGTSNNSIPPVGFIPRGLPPTSVGGR